MKVGTIVANRQQWVGGRTSGGILMPEGEGMYSIWYEGRHQAHIGRTTALTLEEVEAQVRLARDDEIDAILMSFLELPLFPDANADQQAAYKQYLVPSLESLLARVPTMKCPACEVNLPPQASNAQVRHTNRVHSGTIRRACDF